MGVRIRQPKGKTDGAWWVYVAYHKKRWSKRIGDKRAALLAKREIERQLAIGEFSPLQQSGGQTLSAYFADWLDTYARLHLKPGSVAGYETGWKKWIEPALGSTPLQSLTRMSIRALAADMLRQGKAKATVANYFAGLSACLRRAVDDGLILTNPSLRILPKTRDDKKSVAQPLTRDQLQTLLQTCQAHFPDLYPRVLLLARTGLRIGECVALTWGDIDLAQRALFVNKNWHRGIVQTTKSGKGRRVDLSRQLWKVLTTLKAQTDPQPEDLLFPSTSGGHLDLSNFRNRQWARLLNRAGLPIIRIHDLRHTYASLLIQQGSPLAYVKDQLGHYSIRITVDTYGHLSPGANIAEVDKLDGPVGALTVVFPDESGMQNAARKDGFMEE